MSSKENMSLEFIQSLKSNETPSITCLCRFWIFDSKISGCKNNSRESSTAKVDEHIPCGYTMSSIWTFDDIESKHDI